MLCDKCGDRESTVHLCEIVRGITSEMHLCRVCAEMFLPGERSDVADLLEQLPQEVPRDSLYLEEEPPPEPGELEMTAVGRHILIGHLEGGRLRAVTDASARSSSPFWSPNSKLIAHIVAPTEQGTCLRVCTPAGRELQRFCGVLCWEPTLWTPDSRKVCFSWVSQADGSIRHPVLADVRTGVITPTLEDRDLITTCALPAPDGCRLAVVLGDAGPGRATPPAGLVIMRLDGSERRLLLEEERRLLVPLAWSPDSQFLAVLVDEGPPPQEPDELSMPEPGRIALRVMDVTQGETVFEQPGAFNAAWSPDSKRLLLALHDEGTVSLAIAQAEKWSEPVEFCHDVWLPGGRLSDAMWSADSEKVAWLAGRRRECHVSGLDEPLPFEEVTCAAWRPQATELALLTDDEVFVVNPDMPDNPTVAFRVRSEEYYDVVGLTWSPDGRLLAVEAHSAEQGG